MIRGNFPKARGTFPKNAGRPPEKHTKCGTVQVESTAIGIQITSGKILRKNKNGSANQ
jgi:hypothetical protein